MIVVNSFDFIVRFIASLAPMFFDRTPGVGSPYIFDKTLVIGNQPIFFNGSPGISLLSQPLCY